jgi:hypothetical protein
MIGIDTTTLSTEEKKSVDNVLFSPVKTVAKGENP